MSPIHTPTQIYFYFFFIILFSNNNNSNSPAVAQKIKYMNELLYYFATYMKITHQFPATQYYYNKLLKLSSLRKINIHLHKHTRNYFNAPVSKQLIFYNKC